MVKQTEDPGFDVTTFSVGPFLQPLTAAGSGSWNTTGGNFLANATPTIQWQNTSSGATYTSASNVLTT